MAEDRLFTREEAEGLLPQLAPILAALQEGKRRLDQLQRLLEEMSRQAGGNGHLQEAEVAERQRARGRLVEEVNRLIGQIQELGCELKDIDTGLVDFRSLREGRAVYLCWRLGEPGIGFWHDLEAGFAGRQPL